MCSTVPRSPPCAKITLWGSVQVKHVDLYDNLNARSKCCCYFQGSNTRKGQLVAFIIGFLGGDFLAILILFLSVQLSGF